MGVGLHRLWSHSAFKTHKAIEFILMIISTATLQGPVLAWASDHYKHHSFTDKDQDPHSPYKYKNKIVGFLWSHIGWMLFADTTKHISRITMVKLGRNPLLRWQLHYYWQLVVCTNVLFPLLLGYSIGCGAQDAFACIVFVNVARFFQQQATFCVNSLCHFIGKTPFYNGTAGDISWMCIFLLGENWHNFHHAFAQDYRNGHKWYHLDIHKWIIFALEKLGLAWDVVRVSEQRILSKHMDVKNEFLNKAIEIAESARLYSDNIANNARIKIAELEASRLDMKHKVLTKIQKLEKSAHDISDMATYLIEHRSEIKASYLKKIDRKIKRLQKLTDKYEMYLPIPQITT